MVKFCMFSTLLLWSWVGSVMGCCWATATAEIERIRIATLFQQQGKDGAPREGLPPSPSRIHPFNQLGIFSSQNTERVGVIRKIPCNKDLADTMTDLKICRGLGGWQERP